jgi:hypothetical protein
VAALIGEIPYVTLHVESIEPKIAGKIIVKEPEAGTALLV